MTILLMLIFVLTMVLAAIGYSALVKVERLELENQRLKRMNNGQRVAIETLQEQVWFMEDFVKEGA